MSLLTELLFLYEQDNEESQQKIKAGFIPYIFENNVLKLMFMISSDPEFGGAAPMIAKGHVEAGETPAVGGFREAEEELGLKRSNIAGKIKLGWSGTLTGNTDTYKFFVYFGRVKDKTDFNEPDAETERVVWLTPEEFEKEGRDTQRHIVKAIVKKILSK